jgi:hypothetical protein
MFLISTCISKFENMSIKLVYPRHYLVPVLGKEGERSCKGYRFDFCFYDVLIGFF